MTLLPFRYRSLNEQMLLTSEAGDYGFFDETIVPNILSDKLALDERDRLMAMRIIAPSEQDWRVKSLALHTKRKYARHNRSIRYLIVIPTLRCNLSCSYCQVSRAPIDAKGFDWETKHLEALEDFIQEYADDHLKIEFQGGEISLRPDMISAVEEIAQRHCKEIELVACTNLFYISSQFEAFFAKPNFFISTSLDGDVEAMSSNRTGNEQDAKNNIANIRYVIEKYGPDKISFLPTITENNFDHPEALIDLYKDLGASGIFLRPVNFMGFARKSHTDSSTDFDIWVDFFERSFEHIKKINDRTYFEEVYLADLVRQVFGNEKSAFVDFRSPSRFLDDMAVIDFDGSIYPSDEARMLTRTRHVDLSVGSLMTGLDEKKIQSLNSEALNSVNADCIHCAYQPFCGVDLIDDLSRYGRIDMLKRETWFCKKQTFLFDWIFEKVQRRDMQWIEIFSRWVRRSTKPGGNLDTFLA